MTTQGNNRKCKICTNLLSSGEIERNAPICRACFIVLESRKKTTPSGTTTPKPGQPTPSTQSTEGDRLSMTPDSPSGAEQPAGHTPGSTINLNISGAELIAMGDSVDYFMMFGGDLTPSQRENIALKETKEGSRKRAITGHMDKEKTSSSITDIMMDGTRFDVFIETPEYIIPGEMQYFNDRPVQLEIKPQKTRVKHPRAKRIKLNEELSIIGISGPLTKGTSRDVSKTGISFFSPDVVGNAGDVITIGNKQVELVERKKHGSKHLYRGKFV